MNIPSPNIGSSNEPKEPPPKKVCVDDPSNSPSMVPSLDLQTDLADIKPDLTQLNPYNRPQQQQQQQQHISDKDVKPNLDDFKPYLTSPPNSLGQSLLTAHSLIRIGNTIMYFLCNHDIGVLGRAKSLTSISVVHRCSVRVQKVWISSVRIIEVLTL